MKRKKVVRFDVAVDELFGVDVFETAKEMVGQHEEGFELEAPATVVEEIFQGWA